MLKHLVISGLTILTLCFTSGTYSQSSTSARAYYISMIPDAQITMIPVERTTVVYYAPLPAPSEDPYYKYMHVHDMYVENTSAARAVYIINTNVTSSRNIEMVPYRNYVRPSDRDYVEENTWLPTTEPVVVEDLNTTFVPPHGYKTHVSRKVYSHPIRDFRQSYWLTKYYRDEFHNQASYNKTYGAYNYWNSAASDESSK